ncbi:MAG: class I SAM-dependent methyltransferase [Gemmatimonadetes bacterium]|nr:class I SAM-dependent methyltransferase [Gemmatimonadota bacterium]
MKRASEREPSEKSRLGIERIARGIRPDDPELQTWYDRYGRQHGDRLAADLDRLLELAPPPARVLEYGAIPPILTAVAAEAGYRVSALDIAPERFASAIADLGLDVRRCDVETEPVPFESDVFDVVLFNELLEHLRINPISTLREAHRVLKPGGRLMLSTPNLRSFRGIKNLLGKGVAHASSGGIYEQYEKLETLGHMGHVREYTTREVAELLERIGFENDRVIYRGGHGVGVVGLAERLAPGMRPFFSILARKPGVTGYPPVAGDRTAAHPETPGAR